MRLFFKVVTVVFLFVSCITHGTAQDYKLRIYDAERQPLEGAIVIGIPQNWSAYTDRNGEVNATRADTISISYLGLTSLKLSWSEIVAAKGQIHLQTTGLALPEVIVSSGQLRKDLSQQSFSLNTLEIQEAQVSTPAEALALEAGAFVQMSQAGGGSPILRGFEANRVLLVVDGVRMNNAIYRSGHLQNVITIDENAISRLEVNYGAGALAYGSDALGGVIHFHTKNPLPTADVRQKWSGRVGFRQSTATAETSLSAELSYQHNRWSAFTALTASRFGDVRTGSRRPSAYPDFGKRTQYVIREDDQDLVIDNDDPDVQIGSGYEQIDLLQKINWQASKTLLVSLNLQHSTSGKVPRFDRLTERRNSQLRFAEWYYGPQNRTLASLKFQWTLSKFWADDLRMLVAHQIIDEDRFDRRLNDPWREESLVRVKVSSLNLDINRQLSPQTLLQYGGLIRYDQVTAKAQRRSVITDELQLDVNSRYPSQGSDLKGADAFIQLRFHNQDSSFLAELGARYSNQQLFAQFGEDDPIAWPGFYLQGINNKSQSFNGAGGISWRHHHWQFRSHLATGFRAPNIDDFAKFRENDGFVQIPNPNLKPEQSRTVDFSISYHGLPAGEIQVTAYRTWLKDAMVRENFLLPSGASFFLDRGDTLFVQAITNAEQARVWGFSVAVQQQLHPHWQINGQLHYTYGRRDLQTSTGGTLEVPLDHIPPLFGQLRVQFKRGKWEAASQWQFQATKALEQYAVTSFSEENGAFTFNRLGTSDNLELTPFSEEDQHFTGSYGWSAIHLRTSYQFTKQLRLRININNILDTHYRSFASGISAPGRNFIFGIYAWL